MTVEASREDLKDLEEWLATPEGVRNAILAGKVLGLHLVEGHPAMPTEREVENISTMSLEAVRAGRMIDFGFWPHDVIKHCGLRGGPLYNQGALPMPFSEPWVYMHTWSMTPHDPISCCVYLVSQVDGLVCEAVQLDPISLRGIHTLSISDRVLLLEPDAETGERYHVQCAPSPYRILAYGGSLDQMRGAAANVCDPLMAALMMLNTRGVPRETVRPDEKLNRARMKRGRPVFPPFDRVVSAEYVTAIMARRGSRSEPKGGHHASPIAHIRRGHFRQYESGQRSFIRDTLVNVSAEAREQFRSSRTHYTVKL